MSGESTSGSYRWLHVDLGTGLGGWTDPFKDSPEWRSVGIDIRDDLNADIVGDIRQLPIDCSPTLLSMSPPCTEFARWMLPWCDEEDPDLSLVEACLDAVEDLEPEWWVLENSRGLHMYWREARCIVGPYYLWGEFPPVSPELPDGGKMAVSGERPEERAKIPYELADAVRRAVEGQTKLVTDGGRSTDVSYRIGDALDELRSLDEGTAAVVCLDDAWARPGRQGEYGVEYPTHDLEVRKVIVMSDEKTESHEAQGKQEGLNCPVCGVPPMDERGFERRDTVEIDDLEFDVYICWSCHTGFAVASREVQDTDE